MTRSTVMRPSARLFRLAVAVLLAAALIPLTACGSDPATSDTGSTVTPAATAAEPKPTEAPTTTIAPTTVPPTTEPVTDPPADVDCTDAVVAVPEDSRATALRLAEEYVIRAEQCPSAEAVQELLYIWEQNRDFWTDFPAQEARFFDTNVGVGDGGIRSELAGLTSDGVVSVLTQDPDFPMVMDSGPTVIDDMTVYEFSGGLSVLLVITRQDVVTQVYFFDQA